MALGLIALVVSIASVVASVAMGAKQKKEMEDQQAGILIQKQGGSHPIPLIYGKRRVAPIKVWEDISRQRLPIPSVATVADSGFTHNGEFSYASSRDDKDFLHRIDVWCLGEIESINYYEIDDDPMTHKRFINAKSNRPYFRSLNKHGSTSQTMFSQLAAGFDGITTDMRGKGICWSWDSFLYTADTPKYYGDPKLTAEIKGLKVWDPRANPSNSAIKAWSDNPALILLDYLTSEHGKGLSITDLDIPSFKDAADECDVVVSLPSQNPETTGRLIYDPETGEYVYVPAGSYNPNANTTATQKRFTCNLVIQPDVDSKENVSEILKTFKGSLPFVNGKYVVSMEIAGTSSMSFSNDNVIGGVAIAYADRSKRLNQVTVKFPNAAKSYKEDAVTWPTDSSTAYATYLTQDNNEKLNTEATLSGVTSHAQALDMAEFMVKDSRNQQIVTFKAQPLAMQLEPNDIITVSTGALGLTNKPYRVRSVRINNDLTVEISAQEYYANIYPWNVTEPEPAPEYVPSTIFDEPADMQNVTATGVTLLNQDTTAITHITVAWDSIVTGTSTVETILIGHKLTTEIEYTWTICPNDQTQQVITGLIDDVTYDIIARYRNIVGTTSGDVTLQCTTPNANTGIDQAITQTEADEAQEAAENYADGLVVGLQTATDVANAIAADTTVIDGSRITTGTIAAGRISITGLDISELNNDEGYALDTDIPDVSAFQTSTDVANAIAADTTVIDGSRITTGVVNAARVSAGNLVGGSLTDANAAPSGSEQGSFFDLDGGKFLVGNSSNYILWNGSSLIIHGITPFNRLITVYRGQTRNSAAPSTPSAINVTFASNGSSSYSAPSGWSFTQPTGANDDYYSASASASSIGAGTVPAHFFYPEKYRIGPAPATVTWSLTGGTFQPINYSNTYDNTGSPSSRSSTVTATPSSGSAVSSTVTVTPTGNFYALSSSNVYVTASGSTFSITGKSFTSISNTMKRVNFTVNDSTSGLSKACQVWLQVPL